MTCIVTYIHTPSCGLGVEKDNDDTRRNYRFSNHWDAAADMLKTEFRLEQGSKHEQKHQEYNTNLDTGMEVASKKTGGRGKN